MSGKYGKSRERRRDALDRWAAKNPEKVDALRVSWRFRGAEEVKKEMRRTESERQRKWYIGLSAKRLDEIKGSQRYRRETLSDGYVKGLLRKNKIPAHIPAEMVEAKREHIKLMRLIKEVTQ